MTRPARQGLSVLYVLADGWQRERAMAAGLGADTSPLDDLTEARLTPQRVDRIEQARALGGEVIG
jgi:hypothetical protein